MNWASLFSSGSGGIPVGLWGLLVVVAVLAAVAIIVLRQIHHRRSQIELMRAFTVLKVLLPNEVPAAGAPSDWRESLAGFETFFVSLGGLTWRPGGSRPAELWSEFWNGRHDHMSLEMVALDGYIHFYLVVPTALRQLIEVQIQAHYPQAQVEVTDDYNIFRPTSFVQATSLQLTKSPMYPLRTYRHLDGDPLGPLTVALSKVQPGEAAVIQLSIRPKRKGWERVGLNLARHMQEGKRSRANSGGALGVLTASFKTSSPYELQSQGPQYLTPQELELIKALEDKAGKPGFEANIRVVTTSSLQSNARVHLENIINAFTQYRAPESGAALKRGPVVASGPIVRDYLYRNFNPTTMILTSEEVNSLYHFPRPQSSAPNIEWLAAKKGAPPVNMPVDGLALGVNNYRGVDTTVRLRDVDRRRHVYLIGTTGSGKSNLMGNMIVQDIRGGAGVAVVDPHGTLIDEIMGSIPQARMHDVVYFDPADTDRPIGLNMLEAHTPGERDAAAQEMVAIFMKLFPPEMIGPMFEHNMRNAMLTLMADEEQPGTIADIPRMFTDKGFQQYKVSKVKDPVVRSFWEQEMAKTSDFHKSEMLGYLISKVGRFVENGMMRNIIGQPKSGFNFREIMDRRKILLVNLSKGKIGEINAYLLGLIIVAKLQMAALGRADAPEADRRDFFLYIDEFQNFITDSIATILSEARKYKLNLTMAHQYMGQLVQAGHDTKVRDSVLGNVGTMIAFRIGVEDAEILAKQFAPTFTAYDLVNQERFTAYVRLLIDNTAAPPFHMRTLPLTAGSPEVAQAVREYSRLRYGKDQATVEAEILERSRLGRLTVTPTRPLAELSR